ncbi:MAG TPA: hypothetical protein VKA15_09710 [Isosphaeraceae bacterium]|nr:hypothetical protein [Isosphaeraceae bacterium]
MTTVPITLYVDAEAARVYESVTAEDRKKIDVLLSLRLKELLVPTKMTLHEVMNQLGRKAEEHDKRSEPEKTYTIEEARKILEID